MGTIRRVEDIDATFLSEVLDTTVDGSVERTPVGAGQVARCFRLSANQVSLIAKAPSTNEQSRTSARVQHLYEREVSFYQHLAPLIATSTPSCYFAARDDDDDFLLLLEDVRVTTPLDQFADLPVSVIHEGLRQLAGLHGPSAQHPELFDAAWLRGVSNETRPLFANILPSLFGQFLDRYRDQVPEATANVIRTLQEKLPLFSNYQPPTPVVTHGDFRTDNLLIDVGATPPSITVVDWQTVAVSSPMLDVAYFLTTSVAPSLLADHEASLLALYLAELANHGLTYDATLARREFARYTLQPIIMLVAAAMMVERTERGDAMFLAMIDRAMVAVKRWRALDELDRHAAA
jgi:Ecdysteroid kinase-like family